MCGLCGIWCAERGNQGENANRMASRLAHRGPDDFGLWEDSAAGIALAFRRLSILDLSPAGHQPMRSADGRYVALLNGEIYNYLELRALLERTRAVSQGAWIGHSDTETLLACFSAWGVETTLKQIVGMFAIALWDRKDRILTLARDRMGEKPLYYGWQGSTLLFASELKALRVHPAFSAEIDRGSLALLLRYSCIPAPHSIFHGIQKLLPGHYINFPLHTGSASRAQAARQTPYWTVQQAVASGQSAAFDWTDNQAVAALEERLSQSVKAQMLSDVPLGALLSGGVDSSTIVALMQAQSSTAVRTFTIGFDEDSYNEAKYAKRIAQHLGTDHTELYVRPADALDTIAKLPEIYCEPFSDSSQIPTRLVSELVRKHVTVALSGDAGDELFGGYNRYLLACRLWSKLRYLPTHLRASLAAALRSLSPSAWNALYRPLHRLLPSSLQVTMPGDKAHKLSEVIDAPDEHSFYKALRSEWKDPGEVVRGAQEPLTILDDRASWPQTDGFEHWMMAMDAQTYLPDDILVKVDRAAMSVSLETRAPFLDHRVVELSWRLPLRMKIRNGQGKWVLRKVLYKYVPSELVERPKMGFGIPIDLWLRGPLRDWAEALLTEQRLKNDGYFDPRPIRHKWAEHLSGERNWQQHLWSVLMFQGWLEHQRA